MNSLAHIGTPRHSGRYPYGSGKDPQRSRSFRQEVLDLKKKGMSEKEIAIGFGLKNSSELRARISLEKASERRDAANTALRLKEKGCSNIEIGRQMGINESSVRNLLNPALQEKAAIGEATANMLRKEIGEKKYLDIGAGVENHIGISRTKLLTAISELTQSGEYRLHYVDVEQLGTGKKTSIKVLTAADVTPTEVYRNKSEIRTITNWSEDSGRSYLGLEPITNLDSKRILVRYGEEGGAAMDGVIQLRRGVQDISLGEAKYAQVRIGVDGSHYLKGMAIYGDDLPDGVDLIFNTNKSSALGKLGVMKKQKDEENPFGSTVRQKHYIDADGKTQLSPLNMVGTATNPHSGEEGSWDTWSKSLSSQFLSKQSPALAKEQLKLSLDIQKKEFDEILALTNPVVKVRLLDSFADDCDSKAVHLKAAALPRQGNKVLIPLTSLKENECYTTTYNNGEKLALIRHPHGGIFEIGVVTVNNHNAEGKSILGDGRDVIGIHPKMAQKLSGADFDGDSVLTIPYSKRIQVSGTLKELENFDPKLAYPKHDGMIVITNKNKQTEMGKVSNLITDMTIKGAPANEIARAVKHSMVVIDAEKWELDYRQSYVDNGIASLKVKYQGGTLAQPKGASTLISKSSSEIRVGVRRPVNKRTDVPNNPALATAVRKNEYSVDPLTGRKIFVPTEETYTTKKGKVVRRQIHTTKMYEEEDALKLSSGTLIETVYGEYANNMKGLGNAARKASISIPPLKYSPSAKIAYANEVNSLKGKLSIANSNKPKERQAQLLANKVIAAKKAANPGLDPDDIKKMKGQALEEARLRTGAKKEPIEIKPKEWEAIQAGAISQNALSQILNNTNLDDVKALATPRPKRGISESKLSKAKVLLANGYTQAEVADRLGISVSALTNGMKGDQ